MILNSPYITGSLTVTGNATIQGALIVTGSLSGTASLALNSDLLQGTGSVGFTTTASFNAVSSSQQQISSSLLALTASYTALSSSYTALSGSYNTFSGSASTRITKIENNYATTGSNSFRADQSITGSLVVSSTITAQTLVVQTVTSSIVYSSGSNIFGNQLANTQTFTGSVNITGSLALAGNITSNGTAVVLGSGTTNYLPKFTAASTIGNSAITDDGTTVTLVSRPLSFSASTSQAAGSISRNATYGLTLYGVAGATYDFGLVNKDGNQVMAVPTGTINTIFSGNLGLGVTPSYKLDVYSSTTATQTIANFAAANYSSPSSRTYIQIGTQYGDGSSRIGSANTTGNQSALILQSHSATSGIWNDAMYIDGGGEVLIGTTTNAGYKLDVNGTGRFSGLLTISGVSNNNFQSNRVGTNAHFQTWYESNGTTRRGYFGYGEGGSNNFFLLNEQSGTLNIGTNGTTNLTIASTGAATFSSSVTAAGGVVVDAANATASYTINKSGVSKWLTYNEPTNDSYTIREFGVANRLVILPTTGNVGIGTSAPVTLLQVSGSSTDNLVFVNNTNASGYGSVRCANNGNKAAVFGVGGSSVGSPYANNGYIYTDSAVDLVFAMAGSEKMRIASGGDITTTGKISNSSQTYNLAFTNSAGGGATVLSTMSNAGGALTYGLEGNTASATFTNSTTYSVVIGTPTSTGRSFHLATDGVVRMTIASGGAVTVVGALSKGSGTFRIDHPLESKKDTHQLIHSFVEGPRADLIYRGTTTLISGSAIINIDTSAGMTEGTFAALNRDIQCFTTNESGWDLVKGKVEGNTLTISSQNTESTDKISWMVIGERQDKHIKDTDWTDENGKPILEPLK